MATASIDIRGFQKLVASAETALREIPSDKGSVAGSLERVMQSTQSVQPAVQVASWLEGEMPGLRRRLALAISIEASTPGIQSFVQLDESKISTRTPAQAKELADRVAAKIGDGKPLSDEELKILLDNAADPYFASALAKQLDPEDLAMYVRGIGSGREQVGRSMSTTLVEDLKKWDARYQQLLTGLGTALGTATRQTGDDLKLPHDYAQGWVDAMTGDGPPGTAANLALLTKYGTFSPDFFKTVVGGVYQHELDTDMRGMWSMEAHQMGSYLGAVDVGGAHAYDPLALLLMGASRSGDSAQAALLGHSSETTTIEVDGQTQTVNAFMKYIISDRRWPTDEGEALQHVIAAGMTPQLGGDAVASTTIAKTARTLFNYKIAEIEARADEDHGWFSTIGHLVLDGLGLVPVFGEAADVINGIWYYAEGNVVDGSLSMAAVIPFLGWAATGGKWGRKAEGALDAAKLIHKGNRTPEELAATFALVAKGDEVAPGVFKFDDLAAFNRAANNPHPGVTYQYKDMKWTTDDFGRTSFVEGTLNLEKAGRDPKFQAWLGKQPGSQQGDVGFHIIADSLGGPTNKLNVVPGNGKPLDPVLKNLNQGAYGSMEKALREALKRNPPPKVEIEVTPLYGKGNETIRPDEFQVTTFIDGKPQTYSFPNKPQ